MSTSQQSGDLTIEIVRDEGPYGDWLNRYCRKAETKEILYYCEVSAESQLEIHRGGKKGPVIGTSSACLTTPGATDIVAPERPGNIQLEHVHHEEHPSRTHFTEGEHKFYWNGHTELVEAKTGEVIAQLSSVTGDKPDYKIGKLVIKPHGQSPKLIDLVVMTALIVQERSDEAGAWF